MDICNKLLNDFRGENIPPTESTQFEENNSIWSRISIFWFGEGDVFWKHPSDVYNLSDNYIVTIDITKK